MASSAGDHDMQISLARPYFRFGMFFLSLVVLLFNSQRAPSAQLTFWRPGLQAPAPLTGAAAPQKRADTSLAANNAAPGIVRSSVPLGMAGDVGFNVRAALDANGGALRHVTIQPGATWSF